MKNPFIKCLFFSFFAYNKECLCICHFLLGVKTVFAMFCKVVKTRSFLWWFFFILRVSKYLYKHTYFFHFYSPCIANMFCKCTVIFSKRLQVFFHCKVLQAESCTNGTDCHEVQCFDDFYVACELGTCTCGGHGTVGMSL